MRGGILSLFVVMLILLHIAYAREPEPSAFSQKLESAHFVIYYNTEGRDAAMPQFANEVRDALEFSYDKLVLQDGFRQPLFLPIKIYLTGRSMDMMGSVKGTGPKGLYGLFNPKLREEQQGNSVFAHELFHAIEKSYDETEGSWLTEGSANWAAYEVYSAENFWAKRGAEWLIWPDLKDFEQLDYANGAFWVWLAGKYGGAELMKKVLGASRDYEGTYVVDKALEDAGKTFDDVWEEFSIALYTRDFASVDTLYGQPHISQRKNLPSIVADAEWDGKTTKLERAEYAFDSGGKNPGEPLQILHGHGLNYVNIIPSSQESLKITFSGNETDFRVNAVAKKGKEYAVFKIANSAVVERPDLYEEVVVIVTRSKRGNGFYSIILSKPDVTAEKEEVPPVQEKNAGMKAANNSEKPIWLKAMDFVLGLFRKK